MRQLTSYLILSFCALVLSFSFFVPASAAWPTHSLIRQSNPHYLMGFFDRFKANSKKREGQIQEAGGKLSDNPSEQLKGKAKQAEGTLMEITEKVEDSIKTTTKELQKSLKKTSDEISNSFKELGDKVEKTMEAQ